MSQAGGEKGFECRQEATPLASVVLDEPAEKLIVEGAQFFLV